MKITPPFVILALSVSFDQSFTTRARAPSAPLAGCGKKDFRRLLPLSYLSQSLPEGEKIKERSHPLCRVPNRQVGYCLENFFFPHPARGDDQDIVKRLKPLSPYFRAGGRLPGTNDFATPD